METCGTVQSGCRRIAWPGSQTPIGSSAASLSRRGSWRHSARRSRANDLWGGRSALHGRDNLSGDAVDPLRADARHDLQHAERVRPARALTRDRPLRRKGLVRHQDRAALPFLFRGHGRIVRHPGLRIAGDRDPAARRHAGRRDRCDCAAEEGVRHLGRGAKPDVRN